MSVSFGLRVQLPDSFHPDQVIIQSTGFQFLHNIPITSSISFIFNCHVSRFPPERAPPTLLFLSQEGIPAMICLPEAMNPNNPNIDCHPGTIFWSIDTINPK